MNMIQNLAAAVVLTASVSGAASAAPVILSGTTTGAPSYNRPLSTTGLSSVGTNVGYRSFAFTVNTAGTYTFDAFSSFDNVLSLYTGAFNPASPLTNISAYNDDTNGLNARISSSLLAGTAYNIVFASYENADRGAFTITANGPGTVSQTGAVPEPATWAMLILGMAAIGYSMRRSNVKFDAKIKRMTAAAA